MYFNFVLIQLVSTDIFFLSPPIEKKIENIVLLIINNKIFVWTEDQADHERAAKSLEN